jgi:two-component system phosphate regulon response regulator PhoB
MKRILLVEDDRTLGEVLKAELSRNYQVTWANTRTEAQRVLGSEKFDLAILDIGLPDGNGFDVAESLTKKQMPAQFIFLTARNEPELRLRGFEAGAVDFIPKPFHLKEVLLRVQKIFNAVHITEQVQLPEVTIHLQSHSLHWKSGMIEYPPVKDMMILKILIEKSPGAVSRDEIINRVWGEEKDVSPRTIDNAILRLRQALKDDQEQWIRSVRGIGYQWISTGAHK